MTELKTHLKEINEKIDKLKKERSKILKMIDSSLTEEQKKKLGDKPIMPKLLCRRWRKREPLTEEEKELCKRYNNYMMNRYYYITKNKIDSVKILKAI
jgi:hypothetical protein